MTRRCSYHCGACGSHFTSLRAFDAHRSGPFDAKRVCWDPDRETDLRIAVEDARCEMYAEPKQPIRLWEHGPSVDAIRETYGPARADKAREMAA